MARESSRPDHNTAAPPPLGVITVAVVVVGRGRGREVVKRTDSQRGLDNDHAALLSGFNGMSK